MPSDKFIVIRLWAIAYQQLNKKLILDKACYLAIFVPKNMDENNHFVIFFSFSFIVTYQLYLIIPVYQKWLSSLSIFHLDLNISMLSDICDDNSNHALFFMGKWKLEVWNEDSINKFDSNIVAFFNYLILLFSKKSNIYIQSFVKILLLTYIF